jgi:hypothetical protein
MRKMLVLLAGAAAMLVAAAPASAIQFGEPDGNRHPEVGIMVAKINGVPWWRCSGAIIAPTVYLTAGHCVSGATEVEIWFDSGPVGAAHGYPFTGEYSGEPAPHPSYADFAAFPATYDIGVVLLDSPHPGPYAQLAREGALDTLTRGPARKSARFDLVGYGLQDALPPTIMAERTRYYGQASLVNTVNQLTAGYSVQLTAAPGTGGALCFGDSGGPVYLAGTTSIVAVNSFVLNDQCMGSGFSYRTDTADSLGFLSSYTTTP